MKKFIKKLAIVLGVLLSITLILYLLRVPILRGLGNALIEQDVLQQVDAAFFLSGNYHERLQDVNEIYPLFAPLLITTGSTISQDLKATGVTMTDAELGQLALLNMGIDSSAIGVLNRGTSTYEESEAILGYAQAKGFKKIMVVTSAFHTSRVANVFKDKFQELGIEVVIHGVLPLHYDTSTWWNHEQGMIFVFNEYAKKLYYAWKY